MRARLSVPLIGILAMLFGMLTPTPANAYAGWWLQYMEGSNYKCLEIAGGSTANYALLQENTCKTLGSNSHQLLLITSSNPTTLKVKHSGKCLDAYDRLYVRQLSCSGTPSQSWTADFIDSDPDGSHPRYMFRSNQTGLCMAGIASGVAVYQSTCNSVDLKQIWIARFSVCETCLSTPQSRTVMRDGP